MNLNKITLTLALMIASITVFAASDREQQIADRLAPVGEICMLGEDCADGVAAAAGPQDPETVYNTYCMACHMTGAAGAPILGQADQWSPRITDAIYDNAINGINGMPAKGLCTDCSDDDIIATVDYILENSK